MHEPPTKSWSKMTGRRVWLKNSTTLRMERRQTFIVIFPNLPRVFLLEACLLVWPLIVTLVTAQGALSLTSPKRYLLHFELVPSNQPLKETKIGGSSVPVGFWPTPPPSTNKTKWGQKEDRPVKTTAFGSSFFQTSRLSGFFEVVAIRPRWPDGRLCLLTVWSRCRLDSQLRRGAPLQPGATGGNMRLRNSRENGLF